MKFLKITVNHIFCLTYIFFVAYNLRSQTPALIPGYPIILDSTQGTYNSGASPIIADFDNDGQNEILVCVNLKLNIGYIHLLESNGSELPGFPKQVICNSSFVNSAAGDVNGDGFIDIIVKADMVHVFDYKGNSLNGFPVFFPNSSSNIGDRLAVYDLDNNGNLEIIVGRERYIYVYNSNGQVRSGWPKILSIGNNISVSFPSIGDLNNDNIPEIIFPASSYNSGIQLNDSNKIFIYEPNGQLYLNSVINSDSNYYFWFNPAVIFKNKQKDSVFFVINSNYSPDFSPNSFKVRVSIYNSAGGIVHRFNLDSRYVTDHISMGDLNSDSIPDIVFGNYFYQIFAYTLTGNLFTGFPLFAANYEYRSSSIGKLSSSMSVMAMAWNSDTNYLRAYDNLGNQLPWSPLFPKGIPVSAVTFGDINNDRQVDMLITSFGLLPGGDNCGLYAWTVPGISYETEYFPWPLYCHDRYRTNQYGFIPPDEPVGIQLVSSIVPEKFILHQNYPNPFNPNTNIKIDIPSAVKGQTSDVKLTVYNTLGKEIAVLINERLSAGMYQVTFDGSNLSSGVYFYKLETDGFQETKRMILLK